MLDALEELLVETAARDAKARRQRGEARQEVVDIDSGPPQYPNHQSRGKDGDWRCTECNYHNYANRETCVWKVALFHAELCLVDHI
jgi:hypothetical protein